MARLVEGHRRADNGNDGDESGGGEDGPQDAGAFTQDGGVGFGGALLVLGVAGSFLGAAEFGLAVLFFGDEAFVFRVARGRQRLGARALRACRLS